MWYKKKQEWRLEMVTHFKNGRGKEEEEAVNKAVFCGKHISIQLKVYTNGLRY